MTEVRFDASVEQLQHNAVVHLVGTLTRAAKDQMEDAYREAAPSGTVLLDFTGVDYINSTGIAVVVGILAMARAEGVEVGGFGLTDHYQEVFRITRLSDFMTIYENEAAIPAGA